MYPQIDWSRIYYAVVRVYRNKDKVCYEILGMGETLSSAKVNAVEKYSKNWKGDITGLNFNLNQIDNLHENEKARLNYHKSYVTTMFVEAKIYEYAKEWEVSYFDVILDPSVKENLLRFIRYRKEAHWYDVYHYDREKALNTDTQSKSLCQKTTQK